MLPSIWHIFSLQCFVIRRKNMSNGHRWASFLNKCKVSVGAKSWIWKIHPCTYSVENIQPRQRYCKLCSPSCQSASALVWQGSRGKHRLLSIIFCYNIRHEFKLRKLYRYKHVTYLMQLVAHFYSSLKVLLFHLSLCCLGKALRKKALTYQSKRLSWVYMSNCVTNPV